MQLKSLELLGFKSFAQKTRLEFMPGIIAIVGPNGSGKSNITDAIRWILGEQSSSNLRSGKIEDLIFSGTPNRPAMSIAQVSIHFDNVSGQLPVDYRDVAISRRVLRDGASEFYLNDSRVLLRDIIDLFAKARLGVRGIAVINQGASDVFLRAKPDERREMIEEMLGLKEYRMKKNDAENKLKNTEINLSKAQALLEEIQPHLRFLRRQMTRWSKRSEIEAELRALEKDYFLRQLEAIYHTRVGSEGRKKELEADLSRAREALSRRRLHLETTERAQPELLEKLDALRAKKDGIERERAQLVRELGKLEGKLEAMHQMARNETTRVSPAFDAFKAKTLLERMRADLRHLLGLRSIDEIHAIVRNLLHGVAALYEEASEEVSPQSFQQDNPRLSSIEKEKEVLVKKIEVLGESLASIIREESENAQKAQSSNKTFQEAYRQVEAVSDEVRSIEQMLGALRVEEERAHIQLEDLKMRLREVQWEFSELEAALPHYQFLDVDFDVEQKIFKLRREISALGEIDEALIKEAQETEGRNTFLTTQISDLERAKIDLGGLIVDLDKKIHDIFAQSLHRINDEFQNFFRLMFGGGKARLMLETKKKREKKSALAMLGSEIGSEDETEKEEEIDESEAGIDITVDLPRKKIKSIEMLSGGERSLVSIAALFALVAVSPPPFLVLDEVDAALDEVNARRFSSLLRDLSKKTQFIVVTHNRVTMEAADALYGVTMGDDGVSKVLSLKFDEAEVHAE